MRAATRRSRRSRRGGRPWRPRPSSTATSSGTRARGWAPSSGARGAAIEKIPARSSSMARYDFLVDTYRTERLKTLGVWSQIPETRLRFRAEPRARTPLEHMVHQCMSEEAWMKTMLGIAIARTALPAEETRLAFFEHYAAATDERLT